MAHTKKIVCNKCKKEYKIPLSANFMYFCPACREYNGCECEYGFGPIAPCGIYLGEKLIGQILGENDAYRLECEEMGVNVPLTKGYENLGAYQEAVDIIGNRFIECDH